MNDVHKEEKRFECDGCNEKFSRWENLTRHQENPCSFHYECQFCHDENLIFKSEKEGRKHFLFLPRSSKDEKRSTTVYSCVTNERESRKRAEEYRKQLVEENMERSARWSRKWMAMPEEWKEKERRLLREEKIEKIREQIEQVFPKRSEEYKESLLKKHTEKIDNEPAIKNDILNDMMMVDLMKKKYGQDFLNYVSGELIDIRKVKKQRAKLSKSEKPNLPTGWMCTFCDPEPEFATSQLLEKHIEVVHPEIKTLGIQPAMPSSVRATQSSASFSGGQLVTPSRGGVTQSPSTHSGGQTAKPAMGGATPGSSTYSCGKPVFPQEPIAEWQNEPERVDSDVEDWFEFEVGPVEEGTIEPLTEARWINPS